MGRSQAGREGELGACLGIIEFDVGGWIGGEWERGKTAICQ